MQRTRNNNRGVAYEEYLADVAKEQAEEKAAQDAADQAAAQTPEAQYKASVNQLFSEERNVVLNGVIIDSYLAQFGQIKRGRCSEEQKIAARTQFRQIATDYIRNDANGVILCAMVARNNLHEGAVESYLLCHEVLKTWSGYPEVVEASAPVEQPESEVVAEPVLSPSERFKVNQENLDTVFAIVDGVEISERYLNSLPSRQELLIRRKLEKGHSGDSNFDEYLERRDVKFAMNQEIARKGAEEAR